MKDETIIKQDLLHVVLKSKKMTWINDWPTCSKELMRVSLTVFLGQSWSLNSINIKSASLQGKKIDKKIDRKVCLKPAKDFAGKGKAWLLKKTIYGLWNTRVPEELLKLNVKVLKMTLVYSCINIEEFYMEFMQHMWSNHYTRSSVNKKAFWYLGFCLKERDNNIIIC